MGGEFPLWSMAAVTPGGKEPLQDWISLCFSSVSCSCFLAKNRFLYSWRSITLIGLKIWGDFYPDIIFLATEGHSQPTYKEGTSLLGAPKVGGTSLELVGPSSIVSRWFFLQKITYIPKEISVNFYRVWTLFDMDFLWSKKYATNRNWHWALDQYVSPRKSYKLLPKVCKSCRILAWNNQKIIDMMDAYQHPQA